MDGYQDGWIVVCWHPATRTVRPRTVNTVEALHDLPEAPAVVGVDMVIGCPEHAVPGGRQCDRQARRLLGPSRGTSVFSPPSRSALYANTYAEAVRRNRASGQDAPGLSKQTFHLFPKIRALTEKMTPARQERVREVHPELSFYAMNENAPVSASKHTEAGRIARIELLSTHGFPDVKSALESKSGGALGPDDLLDAYAACWTARRIQANTAERCPPCTETAPRNGRGLRMEIWR